MRPTEELSSFPETSRKSPPEPGVSTLCLTTLPKVQGVLSVSMFLRLCLPVSSLFHSLHLIALSDNFLGSLPWGFHSPVCRKPDLHHLFFIFWKRPLHFLPEGSGGGGEGCLAPTLSLPPHFLNPFPPSAPCPRELGAEPFPALGHCGISNQALIHDLPSTAHRRVKEAARPPLILCWFADLGKSENSRQRKSPGG